MMNIKALLFDIKRYAINDGPGIRTTLFMKGCPLHCVWCHNPESWSPRPQILYKKSKCIGCQTCVETCPQHLLQLTPNGIQFQQGVQGFCSPPCGEGQGEGLLCTSECPTTALEVCGREWTMDDLMAEVEKERAVMTDSGGGVTLCGGEPLMHPDATLSILKELGRRGFHRAVDTTLYASSEVVEAVADHCELLLVDLKLMDSVKHRRYTGVPVEPILQNISRLAERGSQFVIRIPLIEGINADEENIEATARFLSPLTSHLSPLTSHLSPLTIHLLPYHDVGKDKHRRMWSTYNPQNIPMSSPSERVLQRCKAQLEAYGFHVVIGG